MDKTLFSSYFVFREYNFAKYRTTDNMHGIMTHYIGYLRKGHARLVSAEGETEIREGDLFYIPLGCRYKSYWYGEPEICFDSYSFVHFPEDVTAAFRPQTVPMTEKGRKALDALAADKRVCCHSVAMLYTLFGEMLPFLCPSAEDERERTLERAKRYIENHPKFLAKDAARHCGISESGLYALFKERLGKTPVAYKNERLAEKAVFWLTTTDKSIEDIRHLLGVESAAYFRKLVSDATGKTPSEIRRGGRSDI